MQITIQKSFIILVEISENIYRAFLVVINFIFEFVEEKIVEVKSTWNNFSDFYGDIVKSSREFFYSIFNIKKLKLIKINKDLNINNFDYKNQFKNSDFIKYSNSLAPPKYF